MFQIVFIGRIGKHGRDRYHIEIPDEVVQNRELGELIRRLHEENVFVLVEIKPIHGAHRMYRQQHQKH